MHSQKVLPHLASCSATLSGTFFAFIKPNAGKHIAHSAEYCRTVEKVSQLNQLSVSITKSITPIPSLGYEC